MPVDRERTEPARCARNAERSQPAMLTPSDPTRCGTRRRSNSLHYGSAFHTIAKEEAPPAIPHGCSTRPQGACLLPRNTLVAPRGGRRRHVRQTRERYTSWDRRAGPKRPLRSAAQHRNVDGEKPRRMRTPAADRRSEWQPDGGARKAFDRCKGLATKGPVRKRRLRKLLGRYEEHHIPGLLWAHFSRQVQLAECLGHVFLDRCS